MTTYLTITAGFPDVSGDRMRAFNRAVEDLAIQHGAVFYEAETEVEVSAEPPATCPRHGGPWGGDTTCQVCTDVDGNPRPTL